ncbi:MAG: GAF domain-containing protein, partial [Anaerolineae bacterium]|nr:GAF domain-containing protein [Anaerolineae bacterium]
MASGMDATATTVRFLQDENQRLQDSNEELREENTTLRECLKSVRGLQQVIANLNTREQLQPLLDRILYEALRVVDAADGSLVLVDHETEELVFVLVRGALKEKLQGHRMSLDTGIAGWVATHREPVISNETDQDDRFSATIDRTFQFRTQSLACVPLISRGLVLGVIEVINKFSGHPFDSRDMDMLMTLAPIAAT